MSRQRSTDRAIAEIAGRQHGVVTAGQLRAAGVNRDSVQYRVAAGRLHRVHRGVYAVGHARLSTEGRWMAAVLACGDAAALSHRSAAALWKVLPFSAAVVQITIPFGGGRRGKAGIRLFRSRTISKEDVTRHAGIPVTTPARTISDLRRVLPEKLVRRAIRQAEALGLDLGEAIEADHTRSELEHRFLRLCRRRRLPLPAVNATVGGYVVDFHWPERRIIVETDGYRYHRGRQAFEDDRQRDMELRLLGYEVIRFSYRQVSEEPDRVVATLQHLLSRQSGTLNS